jgi:hypothetical protein
MTADGDTQDAGPEWSTYGRALVRSMAEVLPEAPDAAHHLLLETADYWLTVGIALGIGSPAAAERLLRLIEVDDSERAELDRDATAFGEEALG